MCLAMYLFTVGKINESDWSKESPGLFVTKADDRNDNGYLKWNFQDLNAYYIGSSSGCGCGWNEISDFDDQEEKDEKSKDRKSLIQLMEKINSGRSYIVVCWEGEQGEELSEEVRLTLPDIENTSFKFMELIKYFIDVCPDN